MFFIFELTILEYRLLKFSYVRDLFQIEIYVPGIEMLRAVSIIILGISKVIPRYKEQLSIFLLLIRVPRVSDKTMVFLSPKYFVFQKTTLLLNVKTREENNNYLKNILKYQLQSAFK